MKFTIIIFGAYTIRKNTKNFKKILFQMRIKYLNYVIILSNSFITNNKTYVFDRH